MIEDLELLLRKNPGSLRACRITRVKVGYYYKLYILTDAAWEIVCHMAVDFSIRPPHPGFIMGGPSIQILNEHPLLGDHLQCIPGGDGEVFAPPLRLKIMIFDQSHVIAERFELLRIGPIGPN